MIVVIDGYNLLRTVHRSIKGKLDKERSNLISSLGFYAEKKKLEIVLVFDGGEVPRATREVKRGVVVVFAGQKVSADEWITDYIERNKEKSFLLVSCDRKLIASCKPFNVDSIDVSDFYALLNNSVLEDVEASLVSHNSSSFEIYDRGDEESGILSGEALDILMKSAPSSAYGKDDGQTTSKERQKKLTRSKEERRIAQKIKKL